MAGGAERDCRRNYRVVPVDLNNNSTHQKMLTWLILASHAAALRHVWPSSPTKWTEVAAVLSLRIRGGVCEKRHHFRVADSLDQRLGIRFNLVLPDIGKGECHRAQLLRPATQQHAARREIQST